MSPEEIVNQLVEAGIFDPVSEDELRLSTEFQTSVSETRSVVESAGPDTLDELFEGVVTDPNVCETLRRIADDEPEFLAVYLALAEAMEELTHMEALRVAIVVHQFRGEPPRMDGAPERFVPVKGETLDTVLSLYERCIVYIWRENCEKCDVVREDLNDLFADGVPEDIGLFSVYGPDCARYLQEEFDVVGGPTTLFVLDGTVDARLLGAPEVEVLASEIEALRERTVQA